MAGCLTLISIVDQYLSVAYIDDIMMKIKENKKKKQNDQLSQGKDELEQNKKRQCHLFELH